jgi:hypothetical protein
VSHRPPQLTSADMAAWRRLIREAEKAGCGSPAVGDLASAARAARRCVVPGELSKANAFVRLQRATEVFAQAKPSQRLEQAEELGGLVSECRALLDALTPGKGSGRDPPPDPPPRRERADIDG